MFEDRKKGQESKFALDQELQFKAEARRNKMIAEWVGAKLGLAAAEIEDYIKAVRRSDLQEKGDDDVIRKVKGDLDATAGQLNAAVGDVGASVEAPAPDTPRAPGDDALRAAEQTIADTVAGDETPDQDAPQLPLGLDGAAPAAAKENKA